MGRGRITIKKDAVRSAKQIISTLCNRSTLRCIQILSEDGELSVTDIQIAYYRKFREEADQPSISSALIRLHKYGFVNRRRDQKYHLYSIDIDRICQVNEIAKALAEFADKSVKTW